jgi:hypothetical protein
MSEHGVAMERYLQGRTEGLGQKTVPAIFCLPQVPVYVTRMNKLENEVAKTYFIFLLSTFFQKFVIKINHKDRK